MALGLGLGFARRIGGESPQELSNLIVFAAGDSTEEHHFTQFSRAGEAAFETEAANYYEGSVNFVDAARSGSFLLESTALAASASNVNLFWVDDSGVLADGAQITNNVVNLSGAPYIYTLSLGINDHTFTTSAGVTAADYEAGYVYFADRVKAVKGCDVMINTLGRDTGGVDAGANAVMQGMLDAIAASSNAMRGIDVYDLDLVDAKHHTQAAQEIKATREARQIAYYTGNATEQALGPRVTSAVLKTDVIEVNLAHVGGSDITMPSSGMGGINATDDGVAIGLTGLTKVNATQFRVTVPAGNAPVGGSDVRLYVPYGANGGGLASTGASVIKDNSSLALPIQRDIVTVTNGDPLQALDNVVIYCDARGSAKTLSGTDAEAVTALAGSSASMTEVDAGDHFSWDSSAFGGVGGLGFQTLTQMKYGGFTAGSTHSIAMVLEMPDPLVSGDVLFFANAAGSTDNQAKLNIASDGKFYWSLNEASIADAVSGTMVAGQRFVMVLEFSGNNTLNVYVDTMTTPFVSINPRDDFNAWDYILLGARTSGSENTACVGLKIGAYLHTLDVLSLSEKQSIATYWEERFGL
jgi:hypothetical protein